MRKQSPAMIVALLALFVALGGVGIAANGQGLILGQSNSATSNTALSAPVAGGAALRVTNNDTSNGSSSALALGVPSGHPPLTVSSATKVQNLNADTLDGTDSGGFLRSTLPLSLAGSNGSPIINVTNGGTGAAGSFNGKNIGLTVSGIDDGIQTSATGATKSAIWAHHDGSSFGYGVFAQSANGPAVGMAAAAGKTPMTLNGDPFPSATTGFKDYYVMPSPNGVQQTLGQLSVSPGTYAIFAKVGFYKSTGDPFAGTTLVQCELVAGGDSDLSSDTVPAREFAVTPLELFHRFPNAGTVTLSCEKDGGDSIYVYHAKLIALEVSGGTNTAFP